MGHLIQMSIPSSSPYTVPQFFNSRDALGFDFGNLLIVSIFHSLTYSDQANHISSLSPTKSGHMLSLPPHTPYLNFFYGRDAPTITIP